MANNRPGIPDRTSPARLSARRKAQAAAQKRRRAPSRPAGRVLFQTLQLALYLVVAAIVLKDCSASRLFP